MKKKFEFVDMLNLAGMLYRDRTGNEIPWLTVEHTKALMSAFTMLRDEEDEQDAQNAQDNNDIW